MAFRLWMPPGLGTSVRDAVVVGEGTEVVVDVVPGAGNVLVSKTGVAVPLGIAADGTGVGLQESNKTAHRMITERRHRWKTRQFGKR